MNGQEDQILLEIQRFLGSHSTATLATCGDDGPWAADIYFVSRGLRIYFLSDPDTRHGRHIGDGATVVLTVHGEFWHWSEIKGVQMVGWCYPAPDGEAQEGLNLYALKFPFLSELLGGSPADLEALRSAFSVRVYAVDVRWVRWLDNSRGFGFKWERDI